MINPITFFTQRVNTLSDEISKLTIKSRWFGTFRLLAFIAIPTLLIAFKITSLSIFTTCSALVFFLYAVKTHININTLKTQKETLKAYFQNELESLEGWDFTRFDQGKEYDHSSHGYSRDLALFGNHSLFQMVSRTHPFLGQPWLANEMLQLNTSKSNIDAQQYAVKEMSTLNDFREQFVILSRENEIGKSEYSAMKSWFAFIYSLKQIKKLAIVGIFQSAIFLLTIGAIAFGNVSFSILMVPFASMTILLVPYFKHLNTLMAQSDGIAPFLRQISKLLHLIESAPFKGTLLKEKQDTLLGGKKASQEIETLFKAFKRLEYRQNFIVGFLLNFVCLWDVWSLRNIEKIKNRFNNSFEEWMEGINFFDAMVSKGQFAFNHYAANYPIVEEEGGIHLKATLAKHPLIPPVKSVANSFEIRNTGDLKLVTGANMAGKSTFLRTVGVNHVLASMGMPVFCEELVFKPMQLFTSMLTVDDLSAETSYFLAEVERLAHMVAYLGENPDTLLIMDEILKGTNSHDKEEGSRRFIKKLISLSATGIIATHDLNLTKMEEQYPETIENLCFEVAHVGEQMHFDYILYKGATKTMNALQLLKNKGLIDRV